MSTHRATAVADEQRYCICNGGTGRVNRRSPHPAPGPGDAATAAGVRLMTNNVKQQIHVEWPTVTSTPMTEHDGPRCQVGIVSQRRRPVQRQAGRDDERVGNHLTTALAAGVLHERAGDPRVRAKPARHVLICGSRLSSTSADTLL